MNTQTQMTTAPQAASVGLLNLESFELSQRIAKMLSSSTLVPEQYRATVKVKAGKDNFGNMVFRDEPNPNGLSNCVIALNMANRMGADPLMVMQNLYLIEGRPAWSAQFIMAAINSCGRFSALRFDIQDLGEKEVEYTTTEWVDRKKSTVTKKIKINDMSCVALQWSVKLVSALNLQKSLLKWQLKKVGSLKMVVSGRPCQSKCSVIARLHSLAVFTHLNCLWVYVLQMRNRIALSM